MNVKQGDLAITINAQLPENIGRVVSVVKYLGDIFGDKDVWVVDFSRETLVVLDGLREVVSPGLAHVRDAWLRPISGIPESESATNDNKIMEPA